MVLGKYQLRLEGKDAVNSGGMFKDSNEVLKGYGNGYVDVESGIGVDGN